MKDLRIIDNVELKDMILVDNAVWSFGDQLSNGIPIIPFKFDKTDEEFIYLKNFLKDIHQCQDLREPLKAAFSLENPSQFKFEDFIEYYDQDDIEQEQEKDDEYEEYEE